MCRGPALGWRQACHWTLILVSSDCGRESEDVSACVAVPSPCVQASGASVVPLTSEWGIILLVGAFGSRRCLEREARWARGRQPAHLGPRLVSGVNGGSAGCRHLLPCVSPGRLLTAAASEARALPGQAGAGRDQCGSAQEGRTGGQLSRQDQAPELGPWGPACVCVCARANVLAHVCERACVHMCTCAQMCPCVSVGVRARECTHS